MILKSYETTKNNFSKDKNIFLLYGENSGLKIEIKELIKAQKVDEFKKIETLNFWEEEILKSENIFYEEINSDSLFINKKVIIINKASNKFEKYLLDFIEKNNSNISLIMISELLDKKSKLRNLSEKNKKVFCIPCYQDKIDDLAKILNQELKKNNINISNESKNLILNRANGDRINLKNEIIKIISFSNFSKKITFENIKDLTNYSEEIDTGKFVNTCLNGDIIRFRKNLIELNLTSFNYILILKILSSKIQRLIKIKEQNNNQKNSEVLVDNYKPPIFWKEKVDVKKQINIFKLNYLKEIIFNLNKIELECKLNAQNSSIIFLNYLSKICKKANSYS